MRIFTWSVMIIAIALLQYTPRAAARVVDNVSELAAAVVEANAGGDTLIEVADGTYRLDDMLWISASGVTVRGLSGNRSAVVIRGNGMNGNVSHVFNVAGSNFSVRDMTLRDVAHHAIQLQPGVDNVDIRNLHILDTGTQMIKVAYNPDNMAATADNGRVVNCLLEYSAGIGPRDYIGGIDAHNSHGWIVRNCTFKGIRSPSVAVAEHAIHFWSSSKDTLVERNLIINCDRGIGFGLGDQGHTGGIIRNNMIYHADTGNDFSDVGIGLESVTGAWVYNNTIILAHPYRNAIEYRFAATDGVMIFNNLTNRAITSRDGATATLAANITSAQTAWFVNPAAANLHLADTVTGVVDAGLAIEGLTNDFDMQQRPMGAGIDIGADEIEAGQGADVGPDTEPDAESNQTPSDRIALDTEGKKTCFIHTLL